jgi:hypothetical protein
MDADDGIAYGEVGADGDGDGDGAAYGAADGAPEDGAEVNVNAVAAFSLRCDSLKLVWMAVSSIYNYKKDQYGVVKINGMGMRISVETAAKSMQAHVFINKDRCVEAALA